MLGSNWNVKNVILVAKYQYGINILSDEYDESSYFYSDDYEEYYDQEYEVYYPKTESS